MEDSDRENSSDSVDNDNNEGVISSNSELLAKVIIFIAVAIVTTLPCWFGFESQTWRISGTLAGLVIATALAFVAFPAFARKYLADNGWFWVRVPEMSAVAILRDNNLHRIIIACSDKAKQNDLSQALAGLSGVRVEFLSQGRLVWVGCPWKGYKLHGWYENSRDDDDPETDPQYSLDLAERIWDYFSLGGGFTEAFQEEWGVDTADPVQVTPKLVVFAEVVNPQVAMFEVSYFQEAVQKKVLAAWKQAVQDLYYFQYDQDENSADQDESSTDAVPVSVNNSLQTQAQDRINEILGLNLDPLEENTPAWIVLHRFGLRLREVQIRDIDPTDPEVRENLQKIITANTSAQAKAVSAKGEADAVVTKAKAEAEAIKLKGNAEASAVQAILKGKAQGYEAVANSLGLPADVKGLLPVLDTLTEAFDGAGHTFVTGAGGTLETFLLEGLDKLRAQRPAPSPESESEDAGSDESGSDESEPEEETVS